MEKIITVCSPCDRLIEVDLLSVELEEATCPHCNQDLVFDGVVSVLNDSSLQRLIKDSPIPVVVDFFANWCQPCREYAPLFRRFAYQNSTQFSFAKISVEFNPVVAQSLNIKGIPHTLLFNLGTEVKRQVGVLSEDKLSEFVSFKK